MKQKLSPEENRRAWLWAAAIVAVLLSIGMLAFMLADSITLPVRIPRPDAALMQAAAGLDDIAVDMRFDPDSPVAITATQQLTLTNRSGQALDSIVLRSYSGAYLSMDASPAAVDELYTACYGSTFSPGGLIVDSARVDYAAVSPILLDGDARTVLSLPLDTPWQPGETRTVTLTWHAAVPACASRFGHSDGLWMLGNLFPTPALREGDEWEHHEYAAIGDPFRTACANWHVTLTLPRSFTVAASAAATPVIRGDTAVYDWTLPAARDFALTVSDRYQQVSAMEGDTLVTAFALDRKDARAMLKIARQAIRCYSDLWDAYAYPAFTLAQVSFPYGGMEYPGLVMIGTSALRAGGSTLETTVAHETAHQWWAVQAGSDSWNQPWQDESLAVYGTLAYLERWSGEQARRQYADGTIEAAMRITIPGTVTPGCPIDYFSDLRQYTTVVYERGAALWLSLERLMGRDSLNAALADYQTRYRFGEATREDLCALMSRHAGMDLSPLFADHLDTLMDN